MSKLLRVLLVEDSPDDAELTVRALVRGGYQPQWKRVEDAASMEAHLRSEPWDLILSDWSMPRFSALAALEVAKESGRGIPFIVLSGTVTEDTAVEAMRAGARDFLAKGKLTRLGPAIDRELHEHGVRMALQKSEEQLRQAQKMEAVGRLAGGIAHDFNNVLSVILSYGEFVLGDLAGDHPSRADVEEICKAGKRAADLTRQLLMFSRQQVLEPRVLDVNVVLASMDKMLRRILGEDVEMVSSPAASLGRIKADQSGIEQIVVNLVVNARDAMPKGGKLTIVTANVMLDEATARQHLGAHPGPHVMLTVTDTGAGMDDAVKSRIFEPFFTTKPKDKGTGLGLSTVFGIVQSSGGSIGVRSEPGQGACFTVYLPRIDAPADSVAVQDAPVTLRGKETILLVEDEEQVRAVASAILRKQGYYVLEARHPADAIVECEKQERNVHLLLTDVVMPQMGGSELAKALADLQPEMRVLYMSGYTGGDALLRHGILEAEVAFLQKPFTPEVLTRRVREVLDGMPR